MGHFDKPGIGIIPKKFFSSAEAMDLIFSLIRNANSKGVNFHVFFPLTINLWKDDFL